LIDFCSVVVDNRDWASGDSEHFVAVAEFDFVTLMNDQELPLRKGQQIRLAPAKFQPDVRGWVLGSDGSRIGLVPTNYIKILGRRNKEDKSRVIPCATMAPNPYLPTKPEVSKLSNNGRTTVKSSQPSEVDTSEASSASENADTAGMSSDDDCETLVGDPITDET
jgi:hypothetical protein